MDPQTALDNLLSLLADNETDEAAEVAEDIFRWLYQGGFKPKLPPMTFVSLLYGSADVSWSILRGRDTDPTTFIQYRRDSDGIYREWRRY